MIETFQQTLEKETDYFIFSQQIRREIEDNSGLMEIIRNHMSGDESAPYIDEGRNNRVYRIGQLDSGLWIALREPKNDAQDFQNDAQDFRFRYGGNDLLLYALVQYESFAQTAEAMTSKGKRVSRFSVGVVMHNTAAALLVEDLTEGEVRSIRPHWILNWGRFEDTREKVYFDIDVYGVKSLHRYNTIKKERNFKFFAEDARINL